MRYKKFVVCFLEVLEYQMKMKARSNFFLGIEKFSVTAYVVVYLYKCVKGYTYLGIEDIYICYSIN
jgi:hypothetical protein